MTELEEADSDEFRLIALRVVARLDTLATLTSGELNQPVPKALEMMTILLVGILKAHGFERDDIVEMVTLSHEQTRVTLKTPFVGKGGSA